MNTVEYIGCFFDPAQLEAALRDYPTDPLKRKVAAPHVTFAFRPEEIPTRLFGLPVTVKAVGYGCDGENEALQVEPVQMHPDLAALWKAIPAPHITLSVSLKGKAVNSSKLQFTPIPPFVITGVFGGMGQDKTLYTEGEK